MSILGSMRAGVSGLAAQSSALSAISDNIANVSTTGYKATNSAFKTLVTKQTVSSSYASGGVQSASRQEISAQGLLSATSSSTDLAISGNGFFVVNQAANPGVGDTWAYTRAGSFTKDDSGYLRNTSGYYAQAWSLLPWDGSNQASVVNINGINYMKAYYDASGNTVYINDNIIDSTNLRPINLSTIGGTATATRQISMGANLPASTAIGSKEKMSALIYDSLGNASNLSLTFTKESAGGWGMATSVPSGAASIALKDSATNSVYSAAGHLEFSSIPTTGSVISITDASTGQTYTFEFTNNVAGYAGANIPVNVGDGVASVGDAVNNLLAAMKDVMPSSGRFSASGNTLTIQQSVGGGALEINASQTLACVQSAVNPNETTGIATGIFTVEAITEANKNCATINFTSSAVADYAGKTIVVGGVSYKLVQGAAANDGEISIDAAITGGKVVPSKIVELIALKMDNSDVYVASGNSLEILPTSASEDIAINFSAIGGVSGVGRDMTSGWTDISANAITLSKNFTDLSGITQQGSKIPAVMFNSDGTPKNFNLDEMDVVWSNGAQNMDGVSGTPISIKMGDVGTNDGFTQLAGDFTANYIKQDGAKFGNYSGVMVDENGVVTAVFDNGETRPIAILPLATFSNADGMSSLTGNVWIATDESGQAVLKHAGTNGAGEITSYSLEDSTVDMANEFSNMVIVQRAYSASTKIITTADEMLEELTRMI